jgi:hypothetical protein
MLKLGHNQIGTDDLGNLARSLLKLEKLGLEACSRVDDQALKILAAWKSLKYVDVQETKTTQQGIEELTKLRPDLSILSGPFTPSAPKS